MQYKYFYQSADFHSNSPVSIAITPDAGVFALKVPRGIKIYAPNMGVFALEVLRGIKILNRRIDLQIILENKLDKTYSR